MKSLSSKQSRILDFLRRFLEDKGYPPTIRDIQKGCDISSTSVVDYNLNILEREGYIRRDAEVSRGIEFLEARPQVVRVPVIGHIAAGEPLPIPTPETWAPDFSETVEVPAEMTRGRDRVYALRVKGTSMLDALIGDGDLVLLEQAETAENGEMVAAWLKEEKEATLKRFYRERGRIRLQPANAEMKPLYAAPKNLQVKGKVIGVLRQVR